MPCLQSQENHKPKEERKKGKCRKKEMHHTGCKKTTRKKKNWGVSATVAKRCKSLTQGREPCKVKQMHRALR
jgi:hypothetical protein